MKNILTLKFSLTALVCMMLAFMAEAQQKPSPARTAEGVIQGARVQIDYGSPAVKDRPIYGELVPYDQVWRSGANEATTFTTDSELIVEGKTLPAGKYSLFTIPGRNEWTIIFNKVTGQWGTQYDEADDVLRVTVTPKETDTKTEDLTYEIRRDGFSLKWDELEVPVHITRQI
jgi:hypothetical protein